MHLFHPFSCLNFKLGNMPSPHQSNRFPPAWNHPLKVPFCRYPSSGSWSKSKLYNSEAHGVSATATTRCGLGCFQGRDLCYEDVRFRQRDYRGLHVLMCCRTFRRTEKHRGGSEPCQNNLAFCPMFWWVNCKVAVYNHCAFGFAVYSFQTQPNGMMRKKTIHAIAKQLGSAPSGPRCNVLQAIQARLGPNQ